jgi:hypothetical protein
VIADATGKVYSVQKEESGIGIVIDQLYIIIACCY